MELISEYQRKISGRKYGEHITSMIDRHSSVSNALKITIFVAGAIKYVPHHLDDTHGKFHSMSGRNPMSAGTFRKVEKLHHAV